MSKPPSAAPQVASDPWGSLVCPHEGRVVAFDGDAGLGVVVDAAGLRYPFHCTAIADGTRTIAVGTAVHFAVVPGHGGRLEARDLAR